MKTAKEIAVISVFLALLIGGQFVLSGVSGIEVVTVLFISFCFYFGIYRGFILATSFSLLRCFVFGFFPNIVILYLVYYNLVAVIFGFIGYKFNITVNVKQLIIVVLVSAITTFLFTMLDNVITPIFYSFTLTATKVYFMASLTTMIPQIICAVITVALFFIPLLKIYKTVKIPVKSSQNN